MEALKEIQKYIIIPSSSTYPPEIKWDENNTRILIKLYSRYKTKVGTIKIKTMKHMWDIIAEELQKMLGVIVTPNNCENRWKVLDRNYKTFVNNQTATGRGKKYFEYYEDMEKLFCMKKTVNPDILLSSETIHIPNDLEQNEPVREENKENLSKSYHSSTKLLEKKTKNTKRKLSVMENIRQD
ncbi:hypothetical protein NQ318_006665 [Aromia moschata]|uniref:Myb-like domain-containing protein n=1 Tax=Aromia moschata TaxID=1265417 RepID=A0AAV8YSL1_9CUCU|nr:hypothetical protein NQ318_006665 [Aromia moschata]